MAIAGIPLEQLLLVACLFASYPLCYWFLRTWPLSAEKKIQSGTAKSSQYYLKHVLSGTIGVAMVYLVYGFEGVIHSLLPICYTWIILRIYSKTLDVKSQSSLNGFSLALSQTVMLHLSYCHIRRALANDQDTVDVTGTMMIIAQKISSLAWDIRDGRQPQDQLVSRNQKQNSVPPGQLPGLIELFGYTLFFPGILTGPYIPYKSYIRLINAEYECDVDVDREKLPVVDTKQTLMPAVRLLFQGLLLAVFYLTMAHHFPTQILLDFGNHTANPVTLNVLLYRLAMLYFVLQAFKAKLLLAWSWAEGSLALMGARWRLVQTKKDDDSSIEFDWSRLANFSYLGVELASSFQEIARNWNISTHNWLKYYVYIRVIDVYRGGSGGDSRVPSSILSLATLSTFVMSAFWHGFYSGYYLTFVTYVLRLLCILK